MRIAPFIELQCRNLLVCCQMEALKMVCVDWSAINFVIVALIFV
jgi:hypothetical protein